MDLDYPLKEHVDINRLKEIADIRFPEYKSYTQGFINGKFVCINRNSLYRVYVKVKHNQKKGTTRLIIYDGPTVLGNLLLGPLWLKLAYGSFIKEVKEAYDEEMDRL